ncbi:Protein bassoon [Aix galericulata]|nr:Protein bassoon [Aix galericulata]
MHWDGVRHHRGGREPPSGCASIAVRWLWFGVWARAASGRFCPHASPASPQRCQLLARNSLRSGENGTRSWGSEWRPSRCSGKTYEEASGLSTRRQTLGITVSRPPVPSPAPHQELLQLLQPFAAWCPHHLLSPSPVAASPSPP